MEEHCQAGLLHLSRFWQKAETSVAQPRGRRVIQPTRRLIMYGYDHIVKCGTETIAQSEAPEEPMFTTEVGSKLSPKFIVLGIVLAATIFALAGSSDWIQSCLRGW
jgi:hypothetical protein